MKKNLLCTMTMFIYFSVSGEDGYDLWLRYKKCDSPEILASYRATVSGLFVKGNSSTLKAASKEMEVGLNGIMDRPLSQYQQLRNGSGLSGTRWRARWMKTGSTM